MGNILKGFGLLILIGALILANLLVFTVKETDQAIVLRFGDPVRIENEAGLKFKLPYENVVFLDRRNLEYDLLQPVEIITAAEKRLVVDAFIRYKIRDPLLYYQRLSGGSGSERVMRDNVNRRLRDVLGESMREALGEATVKQITTTNRAQLMRQIQNATASEAEAFGVAIVDVKIRRADFLDTNAINVYERMKSDYQQQAQKIRAEGKEEAQKIRAEAEKQVVTILANAEEQSQKIRGEADRERNAIFAAAYNKDPEFFAFYRSLTAYEQALKEGTGKTTMLMSPDSEFFRYFNDVNGRN